MNMKYNPWFSKYYKYLKGKLNGNEHYNDTRFVNTMDRLSKVTSLLNFQEYGIVGNKNGFDKLINLLSRSNYTFEDINDSLIKTYKENLENAMGRMLVNTHSSIYHTNTKDTTNDPNNVNYRIIYIPFNQLHFGNRDEFIRQKLDKVFHKSFNNYIHISEFTSSEIQNMLGFSIMITMNGKISNDWYVGLSDTGFIFRIGWRVSVPADIIIYMLDDCYTHNIKVPVDNIVSGFISKDKFKRLSSSSYKKCFVDIYDDRYSKTLCSIPTFGEFDSNNNLNLITQNPMITELINTKASEVNVIIYEFKFIHEVPNIYPAVNYYDILDSRIIYTDDDFVNDYDGAAVYSTSTEINNFEICTPPIVLDRPIDLSFQTVKNCIGLRDTLLRYADDFVYFGNTLRNDDITEEQFNEVKDRMMNLFIYIYSGYVILLNGSTLMSVIPYEHIKLYEKFYINYTTFLTDNVNFDNYQNYTFDELYDNNYSDFVVKVTSSFDNDSLEPFHIITNITNNFFTHDSSEYKSFNRPVSEELFISMKYNREDEVWLFDYPSIRHFNGISNSFYINDNLKGDEIYKFFVLYSDSEDAIAPRIEPFDLDKTLDFDKFCDEVDKHQGFIKYWHNENKLMKISKIIFGKYDQETTVQILSKILKNKIDGKDFMYEYPSDILYDAAGITTSTDTYDSDSDNAPFAINYLFYTLTMMKDNKDKLQQYFFRHLVNDEYLNSYVDINVKDIIDSDTKHKNPINFSVIHKAPTSLDIESSSMPLNVDLNLFEGIPLIIQNNNNVLSDAYTYVFNEYSDTINHPILGIHSNSYYLHYSDPHDCGYEEYNFANDARVCQLISKYLIAAYDALNDIINEYDKSSFKATRLSNHLDKLNEIISELYEYDGAEFECPDTQNILSSMIDESDPFVLILEDLIMNYDRFEYCIYEGKSIPSIDLINKHIQSTIKFVYRTNGFKAEAYPNVRKLYIQLKRFNKRMSLYQFKEWASTLNVDTLDSLDEYISFNENYSLPDDTFANLGYYLHMYINSVLYRIGEIETLISDIDDLTHFDTLKSYIENIRTNYIFDLYCINVESTNLSAQYNQKPYLGIITVQRDSHFELPTETPSGNISMVFALSVDKASDNKYVITGINKISEYIAFDNSPLICSMTIKSENGTTIGTLNNIVMSFKTISSSSDIFPTVDQLSYNGQTIINVENNHDSFEVNSDGKIVNNTFSNMNYELMIGNIYTPLEHYTELILDNVTFKPKATDRIQISNRVINNFINESHDKNYYNNKMWFKPSRIIHPSESVNGKYFIGQKLYVKTEDDFVFPVYVTAIDHSESRGFMEVEVDQLNSKWFLIDDETLASKYLNEKVLCSIIPDNISNWLDEYSGNYFMYQPITKSEFMTYDDGTNFYNMPGDPLFVTNNADYVYSRLVSNIELDDSFKTYSIKYIDKFYIETNKIMIKMINHNFNNYSDAEIYPVLRSEPNDHNIWKEEIEVFTQKLHELTEKNNEITNEINELYRQQSEETNEYKKQLLGFQIDSLMLKSRNNTNRSKDLMNYITELEHPTTWYNVHSHDAAVIYITNGRAQSTFPYAYDDIKDIPYTEKLNVFLYDYNNKEWLDVNSYTITPVVVDNIGADAKGDYTSSNVLYSLNIEFNEDYTDNPINVLVYIGYNKSDVFDDITLNDNACYTLFKPYLSLNKPVENYDLYNSINIRKHMNGKEVYKFDSLEQIEKFEYDCIHLTRIDNNGKYNSPPLRLFDSTFVNGTSTYTYQDVDLWIKNPFKDTNPESKFKSLRYVANVISPIEYSNATDDNVRVKLICINNNHFNGSVSDITFNAVLSYLNNIQILTITDSSLDVNQTGDYTCTVIKDDEYRPNGGLINVSVSANSTSIINDYGTWIRIPDELKSYRIIPKECLITFKDNVTIDDSYPIYVTLKSEYYKDYEDTIDETNSGLYNPFEYYYDTKNHVRYPISKIQSNDYEKRLTIDTDINTDIKIIKANYIGICRYSLQIIPKNGIINVTGFVPTPLTRERYQFWVNGEDITHNNDKLHIISPTSIQLTNLTSLRNFELIELVYDTECNIVTEYRSNVYTALDGKTFTSYKKSLQHNSPIIKQTLQFVFNVNNHTPLNDYTKSIINNPNNINIDKDILELITVDNPESYNDIHNIPSINGVPLRHPLITSLGFIEASNMDIIKALDKIWKNEQINYPEFGITHRKDIIGRTLNVPVIHVKQNTNYTSDKDYYVGYVTGLTDEYFSMYISDNENDKIYNTSRVLRIIGFIKSGIQIYIDKSMHGKWLHITCEDSIPVVIR